MPAFHPFPGLRYDPAHGAPEAVTAPPYDVLDEDDRAALAAQHRANVVLVDLPRAPEGDDPYAVADATFRRWRAEGVLVQDEPCFYVYRMSWDDGGTTASTTGVLGELELSAPSEGHILPHERTTPKAKSDRLQLLRSTRVNLSPIWGLSPAAGLTALLDTTGDALVDFTDPEGTRHQLWALTDPDRQEAVRTAVGSAPVVIADGHHRFETSLAYRDEQRAAGPDPGADRTLVWIVELADSELRVGPIHRVVRTPAGTDLARVLSGRFEVSGATAAEAVDWVEAGEGPALVTAAGAWRLRPRQGAFDGVADLDSARVDTALGDGEGIEVAYQHGVDNVRRLVERGEVDGGVLLRPASVEQIIQIADGGERMPPKTTFFAPKPRTGVVFRALD